MRGSRSPPWVSGRRARRRAPTSGARRGRAPPQPVSQGHNIGDMQIQHHMRLTDDSGHLSRIIIGVSSCHYAQLIGSGHLHGAWEQAPVRGRPSWLHITVTHGQSIHKSASPSPFILTALPHRHEDQATHVLPRRCRSRRCPSRRSGGAWAPRAGPTPPGWGWWAWAAGGRAWPRWARRRETDPRPTPTAASGRCRRRRGWARNCTAHRCGWQGRQGRGGRSEVQL